jgi:hypothetical protein
METKEKHAWKQGKAYDTFMAAWKQGKAYDTTTLCNTNVMFS